MDNGKISVRYARALLNLARQEQCEEEVYEGMMRFSQNYEHAMAQFNEILTNPIIGIDEKVSLLKNAVGEPLHPCLAHFIEFVADQKRENAIYRIALKFQEMYRYSKDIMLTRVTTATNLPDETLRKLRCFVEQNFDCKAEMHVTVDSSLIGGFIIDIENDRMDASVAGQLEALKEKLK